MPFTALAFSTFSLMRSLIALNTASLFSATDDAGEIDGAAAEAVFDFLTLFKSTYAPT